MITIQEEAEVVKLEEVSCNAFLYSYKLVNDVYIGWGGSGKRGGRGGRQWSGGYGNQGSYSGGQSGGVLLRISSPYIT